MATLDYKQRELLIKCENNSCLIGCVSNINVPEPYSSQIIIKLKCEDVSPISKDETLRFVFGGRGYMAFGNNQDAEIMPYGYSEYGMTYREKQDELDNHFLNKLVLFYPIYNEDGKRTWHKNAKIYSVLERDNIDELFFNVVPTLKMDTGKFEEYLQSETYFDIVGMDGMIYDSPTIIICGNYAYKTKDSITPLLEFSPQSPERWRFSKRDDIVKIDLEKLSAFNKDNIIEADQVYADISFVEDDLCNEIYQCSNYEQLEKDKPIESVVPEDTEDISEDIFEENNLYKRETDFLNGLKQLTLSRKLHYEFNDLVNFHVSVKTNPLTILAGRSGTGKTQLAFSYAKMLDLSEDNGTLLFMPISPSYTEPNDVLGYLNVLNNKYIPAETGFAKFLIHAANDQSKMHLVIFDEMNLSQVEYWFSPFISILEKDVNERYLQLYDPSAQCDNNNEFPSRIKIGENVIFIGTVNIDETTKDFSDRLLDRTFVIKLRSSSFVSFYEESMDNANRVTPAESSKCTGAVEFTQWKNYRREQPKGSNEMSIFENHEDELRFMDEMHVLIERFIPDGGISYRVLRNIANYMGRMPIKDGQMIIPRAQVFDMVINQTVMTKIRGTETQIYELIGVLEPGESAISSSELDKLFSKYRNVSEFEMCRESLKRKAEDLRVNGYTN